MGLLESVIAGILSRVACGEASAWAPKLSRLILTLAVNSMPKLQRDRCREEWGAWADECPGQLSKIVTALGFLIVAQRTKTCNIWAASCVLFTPTRFERGYLAGLLSAILAADKHYMEVSAQEKQVDAETVSECVHKVSRNTIVRMRLRRVLNIARGNKAYDGVPKIALHGLKDGIEVLLLEHDEN